MEWLRPSSGRSNVITSASARDRMPRPCCVSCQLGSHTTTRFTRTRLSDIVHPVSSSQLTQDPDRVRSFGGYDSVLLEKRSKAEERFDRAFFGQRFAFFGKSPHSYLTAPCVVSALG